MPLNAPHLVGPAPEDAEHQCREERRRPRSRNARGDEKQDVCAASAPPRLPRRARRPAAGPLEIVTRRVVEALRPPIILEVQIVRQSGRSRIVSSSPSAVVDSCTRPTPPARDHA